MIGRFSPRFEPELNVPAYCSGDTITVNLGWLRRYPEDVALLTHELTHAVQVYERGQPGWLVEGLADYARFRYGPKEQPGWALPGRLTEGDSYKDGYRVTAKFLVWLDEVHPGAVDELHGRMRAGRVEVEDFEAVAGKPIDALWDECVKSLGDEDRADPRTHLHLGEARP